MDITVRCRQIKVFKEAATTTIDRAISNGKLAEKVAQLWEVHAFMNKLCILKFSKDCVPIDWY